MLAQGRRDTGIIVDASIAMKSADLVSTRHQVFFLEVEYMKKERFAFVVGKEELAALSVLADCEMISRAAVLRRLIR